MPPGEIVFPTMVVEMGLRIRKLKLRWRAFFCDGASPYSPPPAAPPQFLPVLCIGSSSFKGYAVAVHKLRSAVLVSLLTDAASLLGDGHAAVLACEPHTFEATFCLLERSFVGLVHIPLFHTFSSS
ncbi:hypothetical protein KP509_23G044500 [Ceratopteris richardii]|uniref:Uncharacterized protein n=1 Tax=Ceratopteris richardii TaxID=49495 RepID=A0A8T2RZ84_CERRI|nr:hypothetical protein KP509_23G044500 [Ceratopteris richardii]